MMTIDQIVQRMRSAYQNAPNPSVEERQASLRSLLNYLKEHETSALEALSSDLGKSHYEGYITELYTIQSELKTMIKALPKILRPEKIASNMFFTGSKATVEREPLGVVLIYFPWNYPFQLSLVPLIAAIAAGNRVVLSPSPSAPSSAKVIKALTDTLFDPDEVYTLEIGSFEPEQLLEQPWDHIFYTGGPEYASHIAQSAGRRLIPVTLELGGKSPTIVTPNASFELSAKRIVWAKLLNSGQTCVAPDYLMVDATIVDQFMPQLIKALKEQIALSYNNIKGMLPLIRPAKAIELAKWLEGQEVVFGGTVDIENGTMEPTLVRVVDPSCELMQHELFAPILPIVTYNHLSESCDYIIHNDKPLALYVYGNDEDLRYVQQHTSSGSLTLNDSIMQIAHPYLPFGGVGQSGHGRYHAHWGVDTFSHLRSVLKASKVIDPPFRYRLQDPLRKIKRIVKWL